MLERQTLVSPPPLDTSERVEFLTTAEVARRLHKTGKTIRSKIAAGVFCEGVHFFKPEGSQMLWDWQAVVRWVRGEMGKKPEAFLLAGPTVQRKSA